MYVHITSVCVELVLVGVDKLTEAPLKFGVELTAKVTFPFTSFAVSVPDISVLTFPEPDMSPLNVVGESSIVIEISWVVLKSFESLNRKNNDCPFHIFLRMDQYLVEEVILKLLTLLFLLTHK